MAEEINMQFSTEFVNDVHRLYDLAGRGNGTVKVHLPLNAGKDVTVDFIFSNNEVKCHA